MKICVHPLFFSDIDIDFLKMDSFERKEIARLNMFQSPNIPLLSREFVFRIPMSLSPKIRCTHIFKAECIEMFFLYWILIFSSKPHRCKGFYITCMNAFRPYYLPSQFTGQYLGPDHVFKEKSQKPYEINENLSH